jgi:hypothetical protein
LYSMAAKARPVYWFDSLEAVVACAGADEVAGVPPAAGALLAQFDSRSPNYSVKKTARASATAGGITGRWRGPRRRGRAEVDEADSA